MKTKSKFFNKSAIQQYCLVFFQTDTMEWKKKNFYQVYKSAIILFVAFQAGTVELKNFCLLNLIIQQQYLQVVIHTRTVMVWNIVIDIKNDKQCNCIISNCKPRSTTS